MFFFVKVHKYWLTSNKITYRVESLHKSTLVLYLSVNTEFNTSLCYVRRNSGISLLAPRVQSFHCCPHISTFHVCLSHTIATCSTPPPPPPHPGKSLVGLIKITSYTHLMATPTRDKPTTSTHTCYLHRHST